MQNCHQTYHLTCANRIDYIIPGVIKRCCNSASAASPTKSILCNQSLYSDEIVHGINSVNNNNRFNTDYKLSQKDNSDSNLRSNIRDSDSESSTTLGELWKRIDVNIGKK